MKEMFAKANIAGIFSQNLLLPRWRVHTIDANKGGGELVGKFLLMTTGGKIGEYFLQVKLLVIYITCTLRSCHNQSSNNLQLCIAKFN